MCVRYRTLRIKSITVVGKEDYPCGVRHRLAYVAGEPKHQKLRCHRANVGRRRTAAGTREKSLGVVRLFGEPVPRRSTATSARLSSTDPCQLAMSSRPQQRHPEPGW